MIKEMQIRKVLTLKNIQCYPDRTDIKTKKIFKLWTLKFRYLNLQAVWTTFRGKPHEKESNRPILIIILTLYWLHIYIYIYDTNVGCH